VRQSAQRGLLGPQTRWSVAVDGSPLPSGGNGRGHRVCGCRQQDPCTHPYRRYSDPGARIGWNSYRNPVSAPTTTVGFRVEASPLVSDVSRAVRYVE
jgi:hypothetical protein